MDFPREFLATRSELKLRAVRPKPHAALAFDGDLASWRDRAVAKLAELLGVDLIERGGRPDRRRTIRFGEIEAALLVLEVGPGDLSLPAYLLQPLGDRVRGTVLALHGHGEVDAVLGLGPNAYYHHGFALALAKSGYRVLAPELRGFGVLNDVARDAPGYRLAYWDWTEPRSFSSVTDAFLRGQTLIGETVEDLLAWEAWLLDEYELSTLDVVGISYGGDLALIYPCFSHAVGRIFCSGSGGSFDPIFSKCENAPAHCIPHVLKWMDRGEIAGINAPRPIAFHYGAEDVPRAGNYSAAFNESVLPFIDQVRHIYASADAATAVELLVSPDIGHEMDNDLLLQFLHRTSG